MIQPIILGAGGIAAAASNRKILVGVLHALSPTKLIKLGNVVFLHTLPTDHLIQDGIPT